MGRNSVDATKACLIRAVRAVRAALPGWPADRLLLVFGVLLLLNEADFPDAPVFFVGVDFADVEGFFVVVEVPAPAGVFAGAGFFASFGSAGVEALGLVVASPEDCPATGVTTIRAESRPDRQRDASRKAKLGEAKTVMSSLYAAFAAMQHA
jgi:hypothetical protein